MSGTRGSVCTCAVVSVAPSWRFLQPHLLLSPTSTGHRPFRVSSRSKMSTIAPELTVITSPLTGPLLSARDALPTRCLPFTLCVRRRLFAPSNTHLSPISFATSHESGFGKTRTQSGNDCESRPPCAVSKELDKLSTFTVQSHLPFKE